jgi:transcriptional regulator with XRE-family HTH domain
MITEKVVQEVRRLLAEGTLSQRKIAQRTGICRGTVGAIASGKRPDYEMSEPVEEEEIVGPPMRCGGCGGLVYLPCRRCRLQETNSQNRRSLSRQRTAETNERLELDLRPEHRARYEEVLAWRREQGVAGQVSMIPASLFKV